MKKIPFIENTIIIIKSGYMSPVHSPSGCNMFYATYHSDPTQNTAPLITSGTTTTLATPTSATPTRNVTVHGHLELPRGPLRLETLHRPPYQRKPIIKPHPGATPGRKAHAR